MDSGCAATVMKGVVELNTSTIIPVGADEDKRPMIDNSVTGDDSQIYKKLFLGDSWFGSVKYCTEVTWSWFHVFF